MIDINRTNNSNPLWNMANLIFNLYPHFVNLFTVNIIFSIMSWLFYLGFLLFEIFIWVNIKSKYLTREA